jgi:hypothetical protein
MEQVAGVDTVEENAAAIFVPSSAPKGTVRYTESAAKIPKDSNQISYVTGRHITKDKRIPFGSIWHNGRQGKACMQSVCYKKVPFIAVSNYEISS